MTIPDDELQHYYTLLNLTSEATIEDIDAAYLKLSYQKLRQGNQQDAKEIKVAYSKLKAHLQMKAQEESQEQQQQEANSLQQLIELLRQNGFQAQVSVRANQLHIGLNASQVPKPKTAVAKIYTLLETVEYSQLGLATIDTVYIYGLRAPKKAVWQETFPLPQRGVAKDDLDLLSFNNRFSNAITFPVIMLLAILLNAIPMTKFLLRGIQIWIHEFGHATIAWLGGRRAIPLPFGWTNIEPERSLFVYFGVLTLLGLLFWVGWREQRRWPMVLAVVLAVVQFCMTWLNSEDTFQMLLAFGGIGGEFYLSTLLMVSFYFPMPEYWRWDFWRYPVVFGAAFTFWNSFWLWRQIHKGQDDIPWGSMWGGEDDSGGDMNTLLQFEWSNQRIIDTYNSLGGLCLTILLSVYFYFLFKQNRSFFFAIWQRWLARSL